MIPFQKVELEHIPLFREFFFKSKSRLSDQSVGGTLMWRESIGTEFAVVKDILFFRGVDFDGKWSYTAPLGDLKRGVSFLLQHCKEMGETLSFFCVGEEDKDEILKLLPDYCAKQTRDWFDYMYFPEKLATLSGKKLAGQRNHRNFFIKNNPDWKFEIITKENAWEVERFFDQFLLEVQKDSPYFRNEEIAVREVLTHLDLYDFFGGLIRQNGKICAFSFAEIIGDTMFVHIEKASRALRGSYQMILSEMISFFADEKVKYINREDDVGDPGLRYSKEAYHPCKLLAKYQIQKN